MTCNCSVTLRVHFVEHLRDIELPLDAIQKPRIAGHGSNHIKYLTGMNLKQSRITII